MPRKGLNRRAPLGTRMPVRRLDGPGIEHTEDLIELSRPISAKSPGKSPWRWGLVVLGHRSAFRGSRTLTPGELCTRSKQEEVTG